MYRSESKQGKKEESAEMTALNQRVFVATFTFGIGHRFRPRNLLYVTAAHSGIDDGHNDTGLALCSEMLSLHRSVALFRHHP